MPRSSTISVQPCTLEDMPRNMAIYFEAFANRHVFIDCLFPYHWTTKGRQAALKRHTAPDYFSSDPSTVHLKIVDSSLEGVKASDIGTASCDPHIGYARWQIKRRGEGVPPALDEAYNLKGDWWADERKKRLAEFTIKVAVAPRREMMRQTPIDQSLYVLDLMAVMPGFQGGGAGAEALLWGLEQADREGACCGVESATFAEPFYTKFGFERVRYVSVDPTGDLAHYGSDGIVWMVRKPGAPMTYDK